MSPGEYEGRPSDRSIRCLKTTERAGFENVSIAPESTYDIDISGDPRGKIASVSVEGYKGWEVGCEEESKPDFLVGNICRHIDRWTKSVGKTVLYRVLRRIPW